MLIELNPHALFFYETSACGGKVEGMVQNIIADRMFMAY